VARDHAVVLVSHRLSEVRAVADTITVMRGGRVVARDLSPATSESELAALIVGQRVPAVERRAGKPGDVTLALEDVHSAGDRDALHGVTLDVRAGEIVGVAGVLGNGQQGLVRAVVGLESVLHGRVRFDGADVASLSVAERRTRGLAYVAEDRLEEGLVPDFSLAENLLLAGRAPEFSRHGVLDRAALRRRAEAALAEYDVRPRDPDLPARSLSGGNQQRWVLARELARRPRWLVLAQPTRGVDVGGAAFLQGRILAARDAGAAVLLVSADLDEILSLADRIVVLYAGRVAAVLPAGDADARGLGVLMTGGGRA
jgi:simple sugar transport system ATP-binding protein